MDINKDIKIASVEVVIINKIFFCKLKILSLKKVFNPLIDVGLNPKEENYIITIGKEHLGFWKLENNKIVELITPNYEVSPNELFINHLNESTIKIEKYEGIINNILLF